jgi:hypothetical protein
VVLPAKPLTRTVKIKAKVFAHFRRLEFGAATRILLFLFLFCEYKMHACIPFCTYFIV